MIPDWRRADATAGLMIAQFAKYLRKLPVEADIQLNLLAAEWNVGATPDPDSPRTVACRS